MEFWGRRPFALPIAVSGSKENVEWYVAKLSSMQRYVITEL